MIDRLFKILVSIFCISWILKSLIIPAFTYLLLKERYITLASECGNAMDESWFLNQTENPVLKKTTTIHLLRCHEYDKMRKLMMISGLDENVLAYLGLHALEVNQRSAEEFVELHKFQTR